MLFKKQTEKRRRGDRYQYRRGSIPGPGPAHRDLSGSSDTNGDTEGPQVPPLPSSDQTGPLTLAFGS